MHFIGLDLAWAATNPTGIAVLDADGALKHVGSAISDDEILRELDPYVHAECLIAIDAPLRVTNETNPRPAERLLNIDFKHFEAEARPAFKRNKHRLFNPPRGEVLAEKLDVTIDPRSLSTRRAIEVYPHPATVVIFKQRKTLKYKRGKGRTPEERRVHRKREMIRLADHIEKLATAPLPMTVTTHDGWLRLREDLRLAARPFELDQVEDPIDAVLCAYLAMMFALRRHDMKVYGDFPTNGYIATPTLPSDFEPVVSDHDEYDPSAGPLVDLAVEAGRCRLDLIALQEKWEAIEVFVDAEDANERLTPELVTSFRRAADLARAADHQVSELLKRLGP